MNVQIYAAMLPLLCLGKANFRSGCASFALIFAMPVLQNARNIAVTMTIAGIVQRHARSVLILAEQWLHSQHKGKEASGRRLA